MWAPGCWFEAAPLPAGLPAAWQLLRERDGSGAAACLAVHTALAGAHHAIAARGNGVRAPITPAKRWHCLPAAVAILPVGRGTWVGTAGGTWRLASPFFISAACRSCLISSPPYLSPWKHQPSAPRKGGMFLTQHLCVQLPALHLVCCSVTCHSSSPLSLRYAARSCCTFGCV